MTNNHIIINMGTKYRKEDNIMPMYTLNLEIISYYIT